MTILKEIDTGILYEVQMFTDFAFIKMAMSGSGGEMEKISMKELMTRFEESWVSPEVLLTARPE